jgi:hypothetical protein
LFETLNVSNVALIEEMKVLNATWQIRLLRMLSIKESI